MRTLLVAVLLVVTACAGPEPEPLPACLDAVADTSDPPYITCPGAYWEQLWYDTAMQRERYTCWWSCARYGGELYDEVGITYIYEGAWRPYGSPTLRTGSEGCGACQ